MKIFGIMGWKNSGKTGLMERLVAGFTAQGLRVSTIKHAHHDFDIDQEGRDSYRHRAAGAAEVLLASGTRWALMHELRGADEPDLDQLLAKLSPVDLVLIEGFKHASHPKIECRRAAADRPPLADDDPHILAIASDHDIPTDKVVFDLNDTDAIMQFIRGELGL